MKIRIIAVGKPLDKSLAAVQDDFEKRLLPQVQIEWQLVPHASSTAPDECRNAESNKIMTHLKDNDIVILLDERGKMPDNPTFAILWQDWLGRQGQLVFIIGGAFGVNADLRSRAQYVWSLSPLVFPHQLIRVLLVEQLYRTTAIIDNHPYHHV